MSLGSRNIVFGLLATLIVKIKPSFPHYILFSRDRQCMLLLYWARMDGYRREVEVDSGSLNPSSQN